VTGDAAFAIPMCSAIFAADAKSVVLYHFKTKNDIIEAVVLAVFTTAATQMVPVMAAASTPTDRLGATSAPTSRSSIRTGLRPRQW
jgi:hypothetical protein